MYLIQNKKRSYSKFELEKVIKLSDSSFVFEYNGGTRKLYYLRVLAFYMRCRFDASWSVIVSL
jgi:hypothetical protein